MKTKFRPWQKAIMKDSINIKFVPKPRSLDPINKKETEIIKKGLFSKTAKEKKLEKDIMDKLKTYKTYICGILIIPLNEVIKPVIYLLLIIPYVYFKIVIYILGNNYKCNFKQFIKMLLNV